MFADTFFHGFLKVIYSRSMLEDGDWKIQYKTLLDRHSAEAEVLVLLLQKADPSQTAALQPTAACLSNIMPASPLFKRLVKASTLNMGK